MRAVDPAWLTPRRLGIPLARANVVQPASGETKVTITESVRDFDVYILNTVSPFYLTCRKWADVHGTVRRRGEYVVDGAMYHDPRLQGASKPLQTV